MSAAQAVARTQSSQSSTRASIAPKTVLWVLTAATFGVYTAMALLRHRQFGTAGYDLGIFDQAMRRYAHFQAPMVGLKGIGYNIWGDHFHPIIALGAPLYWIWDDPRTLLVLQPALIAISVPVVYRFARRRTGPSPALAICFGYAFSWAFQTMVNFNFHEVAWGVPILALSIDALDRDDDRQLLLFSGLLLLVREDMGILVVILGILRLLKPGRRYRWPGIVLLVGGVVMYEMATTILLPHFSPNGQFAYWQYGPTLGPDLSHAVINSIRRPWHVIDLFFTPAVKTETLLLLMLPLALLPLRSRYCLLALPLLAQRFFEPAERHRLWEPHFHYNALPWVILVLAMIDGAGRLGLFSRPKITAALSAWMLAGPILITAFDRDVAVLHDMFNGQMFAMTSQIRDQEAAVSYLPRNVCVEVDDRIAGHLTAKDWVTIPGLANYRSDFVVLDMSQDSVGGNDGPPPVVALDQVMADDFTKVFERGSIQIWRSPSYHGPTARCGPLGAGPGS
jgi:uncharacterized membrane protein